MPDLRISTLGVFACLAGAVGAIVTLSIVKLSYSPAKASTIKPELVYALTDTPGMDFLDDLSCPASHKKIILLNGVEDSFSRKGDEPYIVRDELKGSRYLEAAMNPEFTHINMRNFDERGRDKTLYGTFEIPQGITKGYFLARTRPAANDTTDTIQFYEFTPEMTVEASGFGKWMPALKKESLSDNPELLVLNLSDFKPYSLDNEHSNLLSLVSSFTTPRFLDYAIADDTVVDFTGIALCKRPLVERGLTLRLGETKEGMSMLNCSNTNKLPLCNSASGDLTCSSEIPIACIKDGDVPMPKNLPLRQQSIFNSGSVRMTTPVAGQSFETRMDANKFCRTQFGKGWRLLTFHDGLGGNLYVNVEGEPAQRMWIDITDQPYANCWSRPND